ncbi:hypothetical protein RchiOBHm_Chr7g0193751 [Rosa chinensis]|uniref:Uncharacterized protein n=1 Tax=Rosa chinensis TaxID=74649 RepID=A0A2P6P5Z1_ROSCH|nr:hypothetical protein RchiOBHm_Chr7g0193751 [Rosa chinensis]
MGFKMPTPQMNAGKSMETTAEKENKVDKAGDLALFAKGTYRVN